MNPNCEVVGVGAATLDYILRVDDAYLSLLSGELEGMQLIDHQTFLDLLAQYPHEPEISVGGCSSNKLKGLAKLGHRCRLAGMIGTDKASSIILKKLDEYHIQTTFSHTPTPSMQVLGIIAPDGRRTFRTLPGANSEYMADHLPPDLFVGARLAIIEGYMIINLPLVKKALSSARKAGAMVSFDLACFEYCRDYAEEMKELCASYVDVLFSNHLEVEALLGTNPEEGCKKLSGIVELAIVSVGKEGCWVGHKGTVNHFPAYPIQNPHDTTGAGDLFASGFLHGLLRGKPLATCAELGARLAHEVIQVSGTDISAQGWERLRNLS